MENNISIEDIFDNKEKDVVYKSKPSVMLSVILIVTGILFIATNGLVTTSPGSMIPMLFISIGIIFLAWGITYAFFSKTKYKLTRDKKSIAFSEIFYDVKERDKLIRIIDKGDIRELEKLKTATIDTLKLRIAATSDGNFCYTQVATYVPYEFVNINEAHKHSPEEAGIILNIQKKQK